MQATIPPMSIHTVSLVGDPVKNRYTPELNELLALIPRTISRIPTANRTTDTILFIHSWVNLARSFLLSYEV